MGKHFKTIPKPCDYCKQLFPKPPKDTHKYWEIRRFCSNKCKFTSGFNKGVHPKGEFKSGHHPVNGFNNRIITLEKHPKWKGGRFISKKRGYVYIRTISRHPRKTSNGYVLEHHLIVEKVLGRFLNQGEVIHHINHNTSDNRLENLYLFQSHSEHLKFHWKERKNPSIHIISNLV